VTRIQTLIIATVFGVAYAVNSVLRGSVVPGLVTGALGAVLVYLVVVRLQGQHAASRRRRERE
jgi:uncharacterized protein (DUF2062 family)